jgi:hypothetical protein
MRPKGIFPSSLLAGMLSPLAYDDILPTPLLILFFFFFEDDCTVYCPYKSFIIPA